MNVVTPCVIPLLPRGPSQHKRGIHQNSLKRRTNMRHRFAIIGLIVGFLAVAVAAFEQHLIAVNPAPEDKRSLRELAKEA
ncbi:MAG TPA: hypothetical protein VHN79_14505, partial [Lacunisphaera sp.]|nr:hypothetical protein [Lacunisphaera sp.]